MTLLPAASAAVVQDSKVRDYLLNADHAQNGGKAGFFAAFGFEKGQWSILRSALLLHARENEVVATEQSPFGLKFTVSCHLQTPDDRNPCVKTVWIVEPDASPRLVTAYP